MTFQPSKEEMATLMRMVNYNAHKISIKSPDIAKDDLVSEGNYALAMSLPKYDPEKGASAWTYCEPRVKGAMLDFVRKSRRPKMSKQNKSDPYTHVEFDDDIHSSGDEKSFSDIDVGLILDLLNPEERKIATLVLYGQTYQAISKVLGINRDDVSKIHKASLAKIKAKLKRQTDI